jgi:lipoate-protein ligase A
MPEVWRLIPLSAPEEPVWNMAFDTALLDAPADAPPVLRFYQWSRPSLSIGYFQSVEKTVRDHRCSERKIAVVRRPTGGGLVPHGSDLTMSLSLPENHERFAGGVSDSYRAVHAVILDALAPLFDGLGFTRCAAPLSGRGKGDGGKNDRVCFEEPVSCDIEWRGAKAVGSSQRRKNGRLLHQTSIQLAGDAAGMALRIARAFETSWDTALAPAPASTSEQKAASVIASDVYVSADWAYCP